MNVFLKDVLFFFLIQLIFILFDQHFIHSSLINFILLNFYYLTKNII